MLQRLLDDHARLRAHATKLGQAVAGSAPNDTAELEELRWALARESLQHLAADERMVLAPLELEGSLSDRAVAAEFRLDLERFNGEFRQHMEHWTGSRAQRHWPRYAKAVQALIARLEDRLDREERDLYPLVMENGQGNIVSPRRNWAGDAWAIRNSINE